ELVGRASNADGMGLYRLRPRTGRKHQLRAHMSALGIPIHNDMFYPTLLAYPDADDFARPLQLLARSIEFVDPITGFDRRFSSRRVLQEASPDEPRRDLPSIDRNTIG